MMGCSAPVPSEDWPSGPQPCPDPDPSEPAGQGAWWVGPGAPGPGTCGPASVGTLLRVTLWGPGWFIVPCRCVVSRLSDPPEPPGRLGTQSAVSYLRPPPRPSVLGVDLGVEPRNPHIFKVPQMTHFSGNLWWVS